MRKSFIKGNPAGIFPPAGLLWFYCTSEILLHQQHLVSFKGLQACIAEALYIDLVEVDA